MATVVGKMADGFQSNVVTITWGPMTGSDVGDGVIIGDLWEVSAQAAGNGTSVSMEGSNDGTNYAAFSTAVTLTMASSKTPVIPVNGHSLYIRPNVTGGTSTTVILTGKRLV